MDYAGDYDHPGYGRMAITHLEGKLNRAYRGMSAPLGHRHFDTLGLPEAPISFSTDREGNIASLAAPLEALVKGIVFARASGRLHESGLRSVLHRHVLPARLGQNSRVSAKVNTLANQNFNADMAKPITAIQLPRLRQCGKGSAARQRFSPSANIWFQLRQSPILCGQRSCAGPGVFG